MNEQPAHSRPLSVRLRETWKHFGHLGLISFGGPAAHIALLHALFVDGLHWLDDHEFSEIFAIGQALPGPGSTQMLFIIAMHRNGLVPALLAFVCWSLPGLSVMTLLAVSSIFVPPQLPAWAIGIRSSLASVAIGLVAAAGLRLASSLIKSRVAIVLCWLACCGGILWSHDAWMAPAVIGLGGLVNYGYHHAVKWIFGRRQIGGGDVEEAAGLVSSDPASPVSADPVTPSDNQASPLLSNVWTSIISLSLFAVTLIGAFALAHYSADESSARQAARVVASIFIVGAIIVGGGPVVIPLLYGYVVEPGWVKPSDFLFGLAVISVLPGPNFNFGAFCAGISLHTVLSPDLHDSFEVWIVVLGALLGYLAIFSPGLIVKVGILPVWKYVRLRDGVHQVLQGVTFTAVGLVFSSVLSLWFDVFPAGTSMQRQTAYACIAISSFVLTALLKIHPLLLIGLGILTGLATALA
eukprot:Partr_v1_DN26165_c0_g1_i2_m10177 putative transporter